MGEDGARTSVTTASMIRSDSLRRADSEEAAEHDNGTVGDQLRCFIRSVRRAHAGSILPVSSASRVRLEEAWPAPRLAAGQCLDVKLRLDVGGRCD